VSATEGASYSLQGTEREKALQKPEFGCYGYRLHKEYRRPGIGHPASTWFDPSASTAGPGAIGINLVDQHMEHIRLTENNIRAIGSSRHICRDAIEDQYPVIVIICDKSLTPSEKTLPNGL